MKFKFEISLWQKNNNNIFTFVKDNEKLHLT